MKESATARRFMTIRVPYETYAEVRDLAIIRGVSMAEIIRRAATTAKETRCP